MALVVQDTNSLKGISYLFVYGSLKKGFSNSYYLEKEFFIGKAKTLKKYAMYQYPRSTFPYLTKEEKVYIQGELYKVKTLKEIDILEEAPNFYFREVIDIKINNKIVQAWVYFIKEKPKEKTILLKEWKE